ncbi:DUF2785 domain-containing protein [Candidatus Bipolaricaulota bacterium]
MDKQFLQQIADSDYAIPDGYSLEELTPELIELLGSTNSITRERSYEILSEWCVGGQYEDDAIRELGRKMVNGLFHGLGEAETDSVFRRSYSALVLCAPIGADQFFGAGLVEGRAPCLDAEEVRTWCARALEAVRGENDLRGFVDGKGWAHSVAHMSDALHQFARTPHTRAEEHLQILETISDRLTRPSDSVFIQDEGGRLMRAAYCVLLHGELPLDALMTWLHSFAKTPDGKTWGWGEDGIFDLEHCNQRAVNARMNVREALRSLYFYLKHGLRRWHSDEDAKNGYYAFYDRPLRNREELIETVDTVLRKGLYSGLYPQD